MDIQEQDSKEQDSKELNIQKQIEHKLLTAFKPTHLKVIDQSHQHSVPDGSQSHFRVEIVSAKFIGMGRMERHRKIYRELRVELDGMIKALSVFPYSPSQWEGKNAVLPDSPPCLGGSRFDKEAKSVS